MEGDVIKVKMWVAQSCPSLCDPMDCGPSGSSIHGIFQARIVKWVAISLSRDLPNAGIEPKSLMSPALSGEFFTTSTTWEAQSNSYANIYSICFLGLLSMHLFAQIVLFFVSSMNQYSADFMVNKTDIVHVLMEYTFSWGYLFPEYRYMI